MIAHQGTPAAGPSGALTGLLIGRIRIALRLALLSIVVFAAADVALVAEGRTALYALKLLQIAMLAIPYWMLRRTQTRRGQSGIALLVVGGMAVTTAAQGIVTHDTATTPLLLMVIALTVSMLLPWGAGPQLLAVGVVTVASVWNVYAVTGGFAALAQYQSIAMLIALIVSVYIAYDFERQRVHAHRAELALRLSEAELRGIFDHLEDIYYRTDLAGTVLRISPSVERYGYRVEEMVGANVIRFYADRTDRERGIAALMATHSVHDQSITLRRKDGALVPVSVTAHLLFDERGQPVGIEGMLRDVSGRKRHEDELAALLDVARLVSGTLEVEEMLAQVQQRTAALLGCDGVVTFQWDAARGEFGLLAQYGMLHASVAWLKETPVPAHVFFGGRLLKGETLVINGPPTAGPAAELLARFPVAALTLTPLSVREQLRGAYVAFSRTPGFCFAPEQVRLFENIARQVAVGLENAQLYQRQQEEAEVSGALAGVGRNMIEALASQGLLDHLCQMTATALGCEFSYTFLYDPDDRVYRGVAGYDVTVERLDAIRVLQIPQHAVAGLVARVDREGVLAWRPTDADSPVPAALPVQSSGAQAVLCMALRRGAESIGIHVAGSRRRDAGFNSAQMRIAAGIGQLASMALQHARVVDELDRANRFKSNFVATLSHELRTPLTVTIGYCDLLLEAVFGALAPAQYDAIERSKRSAEELLDLINATLDLSRFEGKPLAIVLTEVSVAELMQQLAEDVAALPGNPEVALRWVIPEDLPPLRTDRVKLRMTLKNLIGNALKFTERGEITVSASASDDSVSFVVSDTGIGMTPEFRGRIFQPFEQADGGLAMGHGGAGLGLYIVARVLEMLGGTIAVESEVGRGSVFRVSIPNGLGDHRIATPSPHTVTARDSDADRASRST